MKKPFFNSLRTKMLVSFWLLITTTLIIMLLAINFGIPFTDFKGKYRDHQEVVLRNLNLEADLIKERLLSWIEERRDDTSVLAETTSAQVSRLQGIIEKISGERKAGKLWKSVWQSKIYQSILKQINLIKTTYGVYAKIQIADPQSGKIIVSTDRLDLGMNILQKDSIIKTLLLSDISIKIRKEPITGKFKLLIFKLIKSASGRNKKGIQNAGLLIMHVDTEDIVKPILQAREGLGKTGEVLLVDRDRRILMKLKHPLADGLTAKILEYQIQSRQASLAAHGEEGITISKDYRGEPVLAAYRHITITQELAWGMVVKRDKEEVFANIKKSMGYTSTIGAISILIALGLTYLIAMGLTRSIQVLTQTARQVSAGDLNARAYITSGDETGILAATFNSMIQHIQSKTELIHLLQEIIATANEASTVKEAMQICLDKVCLHTGWPVGYVYIPDSTGELFPTNLWHLKNPQKFETFRKITETTPFKPGVGLPGRVLASGKPAWIIDVTKDANFPRATLAKDIGVKSGFAFPVLEGKRVVAVLEFFSEEIQQPDESLLDAISHLATQLGRVTERKRAEEQTIASLKEKEVLLKEVHHRVKNNMQIISSLLKLQSRYIKDKQYIEMFKESKNRIKSMALIHEKLYKSKDLANVDFKLYIKDLITGLFKSYSTISNNVLLKINIENVLLGVDTAIPCGLVINELVSNSLKYAFPDGRKGEINIALQRISEYEFRNADLKPETGNPKPKILELIVSDNGVGMPEDIDYQNTKSMGLQLFKIIAKDQLQGAIELSRDRGTEFRIRFKELAMKERV